jgi:hypothetical protein
MYSASRIAGVNGPLVNEFIDLGKVNLIDLPENVLVKKDGTVGALNQRQLVQCFLYNKRSPPRRKIIIEKEPTP